MAKLHVCPATFPHDDIYQTHFQQYAPLTLSPFQKWAIKAIVDGDNVLITAHTGSGKTLPAEFAINFFKTQNKKVIYASPIKALSNQKLYDMRRKYPHISFGLLTGDCKDNPEADVLIMTTEILRNTLFNRRQQNCAEGALAFHIDVETELAAVVFDEVHYINDVERGSVWEQSILLLPPQVQLIMLSATIDRPDAFATWILQEKAKQAQEQKQQMKHMYLASTAERVVPLTHYMWLSVHSGTLKKAAKTPYEKKLEAVNGTPIVIADAHGVYNELHYYKVKDILDYNSKNQLYVKRQFVLDSLIRYLKTQAMLPAICFIFSRKHVEQAAAEISFSLHDEDMSVSIEKECRHILASKLVNYKEYLELPEYQAILKLLEKGIAIHHAGLMPVLREMIELLFEKGYIKLLFATETFAVGINMPTKTVIFTGLTKFNGSTMRLLYPHEYTQMAGRAGRRGIDTVGHVFHCNNLFDNPSCSEYKHLLTGPPQKLTSKFKISFNLALNVFFADTGPAADSSLQGDSRLQRNSSLHHFTQKSLLSTDIQTELVFYAKEKTELTAALAKKTEVLQLCRTPEAVLQQYTTLLHSMVDSKHSERKKIRQALTALEVAHKFLANDLKYLEAVTEAEKVLATNACQEKTERAYISTVIQCVEEILLHNDFLTSKKTLTSKGLVASQLQEVHPLVLADTYGETDGFAECTALDIATLLACFNNIHVSDELKCHRPVTPSGLVNTLSHYMADRLDYYYSLEVRAQIDTGSAYAINYDLQPYIMAWYAAADEGACKTVIATIKHEKNIFLGEFIKGILKIINICAEFEKICELNGNVGLLAKMQAIPAKMLKYVVTNQSLYL
jgi:superfamily II RNA helicase